ncbi:MAG TPA: AAA family ATPase [Longimicrobium sp.]|jgi:hypothetical protein
MPEEVTLTSTDSALGKLQFGDTWRTVREYLTDEGHAKRMAIIGRWGSRPAVAALNDYQALVEYLLAQDVDASLRYRDEAETTNQYNPVPLTLLRRVVKLWESILPHRRLVVTTGRIQVQAPEGSSYSAAEMSDGERVIFYLAGSCVCAEPNSVLLIDEPELHLHRLIQQRLWDLVEAERRDCLFVYFTHDLEFAASRSAQTRIAVRNYDGRVWEWMMVPTDDNIPEDVMLTIAGSRKPILFTEGVRSGIDAQIYSQVYPDHTVMPMGSCRTVVHAVKSFRMLTVLHALDCKGLIDRDQRSETERTALSQDAIFTIPVSEVENLLLLEPVLRCVAQILHRDEVDDLVDKVKVQVFARLAKDKESIASSMLGAYLEKHLTAMTNSGKVENEIALALQEAASSLGTLVAGFEQQIDKVLSERDYNAALALYANKGLAAEVTKLFGFNYREEAVRLLGKDAGQPIIEELKKVLPKL